MFGVDGSKKWSRALAGVTSVHWLDDGALGVITAVGILRLDAKTGEPRALRCGWGFGLSPKQHGFASRLETLCTQAH